MRIGVVSDTHGQVMFARQAVRILESCDVELVIHCGDIGSAAIVPLFSPWPTHYVLGNVDGGGGGLKEAIAAAGHTCHGRFGQLELDGRRIAFLHGDDTNRLHDAIQSGDWDLVCHGHTHVPRNERLGRTLVLNPGALHRANPHSIALVELPKLDVTTIVV